jgi:zinc protease
VAGCGFAMREDDPEFPALRIGGHLIGGGFLNSRLATRIRQKEGLSYGVNGGFFASPLDRDARFAAFMIYNPANLAKLETAFREEIEKVVKEGFTAEELQAGKTGWLKSRKVARSSDSALSRTLSTFLFYGRDLMWDAKQEEAVQNISLAQVQDAVRKYLDYSKIISVKAGDFSKPTKL